MLGEPSAACVVAGLEAGAVECRWFASCRALELKVLSSCLVGRAGGDRCWVGATVANVTADCLHGTGVGRTTWDCNWDAAGLTEKSRNGDRRQDMQVDCYPVFG
jgi:hypothetical protein